MLGVYDYTVILTYISLWISIGGMMLSLNGHLDLAVLCLALSVLELDRRSSVIVWE